MTGGRGAFRPTAPGLARLVDLSALVLVALIGLALLDTARYVPELGYDESASILGMSVLHGHFGNHPDPMGGARASRYRVMDCYPPVYYLASAAVFRVAGFGLTQARAVSVLFVCATVLLCYAFGRRYYGVAAGLVALATALYVPLGVYTVVARPDVAVPFFLLASLMALVEAHVAQSPWMYAASGGLYLLAVLSHFGALMVVPVFVALWLALLPRQSRAASATAFIMAAGGLTLAYLWLLSPYAPTTLKVVLGYAYVGQTVPDPSFTNRWPLRPALQHLTLLRLQHPAILFGAVPLAVVVLSMPRIRRRIGLPGTVATAAFLGSFVMMGAYPNIQVFGYYGPFYLMFAACALSAGIWTIAARTRQGRVVTASVAFLVALSGAAAIESGRRQRVAAVQGIPLSVIERWTSGFAELRTPTLAGPHWVFSAAGERVLSRAMAKERSDGFEIDRDLAEIAPELPPLDAFGAMVTDQYDDINDTTVLLNEARNSRSPRPEAPWRTSASLRDYYAGSLRLRMRQFELVGAIRDGFRASANASVWRRSDPRHAVRAWPRVARATPAGAEEQVVFPACVVTASGRSGDLQIGSLLWAWRMPLAAPSPAHDHGGLLVARIALREVPSAPRTLPRAFAVYYPDRAQESAGVAFLVEGRVPNLSPAASIGVIDGRLPDGRRGRDLLIQPSSGPGGGVLVVYGFAPDLVESVDFALAVPPGQVCTPETARDLQEMARKAAAPDVFVLASAPVVDVGQPFTVTLSGVADGELVAFRDGRVVLRQSFAGTRQPTARLRESGRYGIEVWITNSADRSRSVSAVFTEVKAK